MNSYARIAGLEADANRMMGEMAAIVAKLQELGSASAEEQERMIDAVYEEFNELQRRIGEFTRDGHDALQAVDRTVRDHPYQFIFGALGLGFLIGRS